MAELQRIYFNPNQSWDSFINFLKIANITIIDDSYCEIHNVFNNKKLLRRYYEYSKKVDINYRNKAIIIPKDVFFANAVDLRNQTNVKPLLLKKTQGVITVDFRSQLQKQEECNQFKHSNFNLIKKCVENDIPVYLLGEAGTGKNFTLKDIADELDLEFYFTNAVQQEYRLTGFIDAGGIYHQTEFYKACINGGLFFLDEMDVSIPDVLKLLNGAIANRYFDFPNGRIDLHEKTRFVAAGNTAGDGANELYVAGAVLDSSVLDRFVIIEHDYDIKIEQLLAEGREHLVNFVRGLRKFAKINGIRKTFSYRCIINTVKLEKAGVELTDILTIAIFKNCDKDTLKMFKTDYIDGSAGKYYFAMKALQEAVE